MFVDYLPFGGVSTATPFQLCQPGENPPEHFPGTLTREKCDYQWTATPWQTFGGKHLRLQFGSLQRWVFDKAELGSPSYIHMYPPHICVPLICVPLICSCRLVLYHTQCMSGLKRIHFLVKTQNMLVSTNWQISGMAYQQIQIDPQYIWNTFICMESNSDWHWTIFWLW